MNYRNQSHWAERKNKASKISKVNASAEAGIQAILPGFGIIFFFSCQFLTKNGLDVLKSRVVFVNFLRCGLFSLLGCLGCRQAVEVWVPSSSTCNGDRGSAFVPTMLLLIFTRTFHVKTASLENMRKENHDWDLSNSIICHSEIHFRSQAKVGTSWISQKIMFGQHSIESSFQNLATSK